MSEHAQRPRPAWLQRSCRAVQLRGCCTHTRKHAHLHIYRAQTRAGAGAAKRTQSVPCMVWYKPCTRWWCQGGPGKSSCVQQQQLVAMPSQNNRTPRCEKRRLWFKPRVLGAFLHVRAEPSGWQLQRRRRRGTRMRARPCGAAREHGWGVRKSGMHACMRACATHRAYLRAHAQRHAALTRTRAPRTQPTKKRRHPRFARTTRMYVYGYGLAQPHASL